MTLYKTKNVLSRSSEQIKYTNRIPEINKKIKEERKMEIKELCDRCFKDMEDEKTIYKYGSAVYCEKCHEKIEQEILKDMENLYIQKIC